MAGSVFGLKIRKRSIWCCSCVVQARAYHSNQSPSTACCAMRRMVAIDCLRYKLSTCLRHMDVDEVVRDDHFSLLCCSPIGRRTSCKLYSLSIEHQYDLLIADSS